MKIIFDEKDKSFAERINTALEEDNDEIFPLLLSRKGTKYYLEFECTDIGKANAFAWNFMRSNCKDVLELEEEIGIKVTAINYSIGSKIDETRNILQEAIDKINNL